MGEDFIRKCGSAFVTRRDAAFERLGTPDLFSPIEPQHTRVVLGIPLNGVSLEHGQKLWQMPADPAAEHVVFCHGAIPAVELSREAAAVAARAQADCGAPLTATVAEVSHVEEWVSLRLRKPFGAD